MIQQQLAARQEVAGSQEAASLCTDAKAEEAELAPASPEEARDLSLAVSQQIKSCCLLSTDHTPPPERRPGHCSRPRFQDVTTGMRLRYLEQGQGSEVVVLLHDLAESSLIWEPLAAFLSDMGYHVLAPDLRGHGGSSASCQGDYSIASMCRDLHSFVLELGIYTCRFALVGAGLGGAVALTFAAQHPQLVAGLALLAYDPGQTLPAFHPAQAASFADWGEAVAFFCSPAWGAAARSARHVAAALHAMLRPGPCGRGLVVAMDSKFLLQDAHSHLQDSLEQVQCHLHMLLPCPSQEDAAHSQRVLEQATAAASRQLTAIQSSTPYIVTDAGSQVSKALLAWLDNIADNLQPPAAGEERTPQLLGLRPLPDFDNLQQACKALLPKMRPSMQSINAALTELGTDDVVGNRYQTALAKEPADYFGFVG